MYPLRSLFCIIDEGVESWTYDWFVCWKHDEGNDDDGPIDCKGGTSKIVIADLLSC